MEPKILTITITLNIIQRAPSEINIIIIIIIIILIIFIIIIIIIIIIIKNNLPLALKSFFDLNA